VDRSPSTMADSMVTAFSFELCAACFLFSG